jgi:uncharacterized integral membrane protein (TIGR00698 family)
MARLPGLALTALVAIAAFGAAAVERRIFDSALVDALVLAILIGAVVRASLPISPRAESGVEFAAKELLELAVCLLGAAVNIPALVNAGPALALGIVAVVGVGLFVSYGIGRALKLSRTHAILVASGNAICGNSAIAAVAPVIGAEREEIASAISFTAVLGVIVVVALPLLMTPLGLSEYQYGVLAGLTIYSVPQVLAAAFPVSAVAGQIATLVKLVRVLMLGPVVLYFTVTHRVAREKIRVAGLVPWFILGFVALATLRAFELIPGEVQSALAWLASALTLVAMAALGLGVDLRSVARAGRGVVLTVVASLIALVALSLGLIYGLGIR